MLVIDVTNGGHVLVNKAVCDNLYNKLMYLATI